jgi:hypothetical protein
MHSCLQYSCTCIAHVHTCMYASGVDAPLVTPTVIFPFGKKSCSKMYRSVCVHMCRHTFRTKICTQVHKPTHTRKHTAVPTRAPYTCISIAVSGFHSSNCIFFAFRVDKRTHESISCPLLRSGSFDQILKKKALNPTKLGQKLRGERKEWLHATTPRLRT